MEKTLRVLVWDENPDHVPKSVYPLGIRGEIAGCLAQLGAEHADLPRIVATAVHLDQPEQGLEKLDQAEVLIWWGHRRQAEVTDASAEAIRHRVHEQGMGLIVLHSAHYSKVFRRVLDCSGDLKGGWREDEQPEILRVCAPEHPIAAGVADFTLETEEMYAAPFAVPPAECLIFQSYFPAGGEFFPSGLAWSTGQGIAPDFHSGPGGGVGQGRGKG
ncbi:MAG TPA: ThuA domain-containing protein, partial [Candidatus Obscuribacterales bacterium]